MVVLTTAPMSPLVALRAHGYAGTSLRVTVAIGAGHLVIPPLAFLIASTVVVGLILAWLVRALRSRVASDRGRRLPPSAVPAPVDYFALADRRAASGDYSGALWALAAGVAGALSGERVWSSSPLAVREIFRLAPAGGLSPLLQAFEATAYGHHAVDAPTYTRAAAAAGPFRQKRMPT